MCDMSCTHVTMYREKNGICSYEILHAFYVSCIAKDSLKRKAQDCICSRCQNYKRIHACLYCIYFGCFNDRHIHEHALDKNHILAIDTNYGHVYCFICGDYQYDAEFERIAQEQQLIASHKKGVLKQEPNSEEMAVIKQHHKVVNISKMGLRGIVNMGNTCYISVILQSLVHAPLFRDYFLTLQHKCSYRKTAIRSQDITSEIKSSQEITSELPVCFACEISDIVQEFFSGKEAPFTPNRLLHLLWTHEVELRGYKQQDAHEFFLKLLYNLHLNCKGSNGNSVSDHRCKCIIDTIFTGFSKYVYTCQECFYEYSKNTSFKDLTLVQTSTTNDSEDVSLLDCLTKSLMSVVNEVLCSVCNQKKSFTVHMTLTKLPLIVSFHINQLCEKKFISFPEVLDMTPYVFTHKDQGNMEDKPPNSLSESSNNIFYLFAVVEHIGEPQSGHYQCYVRRHKTDWFLCSDLVVQQVSVEDVLKKNAYLLFYHKQILEYEVEDINEEMELST